MILMHMYVHEREGVRGQNEGRRKVDNEGGGRRGACACGRGGGGGGGGDE